MPQFCECGRLMEMLSTYKTSDFSDSNNPVGRLVTRKVFRCPECKKERIVNGRGKEVKK